MKFIDAFNKITRNKFKQTIIIQSYVANKPLLIISDREVSFICSNFHSRVTVTHRTDK